MYYKLLMTLSSLTLCGADDLFSVKFVKSINRQNTTWKARMNFIPGSDIDSISHLMGEKPKYWIKLPQKQPRPAGFSTFVLPKHFNAYDKWSYCPSIIEIRDQGACGSCWAISTSSVITDRVCIKSQGLKRTDFSAQDLLGCCSNCGAGCNGGSSAAALNHWILKGLVSGGAYNSDAGCKPYMFEPCQHHVDGPRPACKSMNITSPECLKECADTHYLEYNEDIYKGDKAYIIKNDSRSIMEEIYNHGPCVGIFKVHEDFLQYKCGVYQHVTGNYLGRHAVKLIGWGEEDGIPYWLVVNSWNTDWGDKGFFKILRGSNHCRIEDYVIAALPQIKT